MNYQLHYDRLIDRARQRAVVGYTEKHHVTPRCLGGDNSAANIVRLTAQEHYVAHLLLMKAHPENRKLMHAAWTMMRRSRFVEGRSGGKVYSWLRVRYAEMMRERMTGQEMSPEVRAKKSEAAKRNNVPAEQRQRMVEASSLAKSAPEYRAKISAAMKAKWADPEFRAMMAAAEPQKSSQKRSDAMALRWEDPDYRAKHSPRLAALSSGRAHSEETKAKMSASHRGRTMSPETREKMSIAALAWRKAKREAA